MPKSRSYKLLLSAALLVIGGLAAGARAAPAAEAQKAKLSFAPLPEAGAVLARPDDRGMRLFSNIIIPHTVIQIDNTAKEAGFTLGHAKYTVTLTDPKIAPAKSEEDYQRDTRDFLIKFDGGEARLERPEPQSMSFKPISLKLDQGREYALAFPYGYTMSFTTGTIFRTKQHRGALMYRSGGVQQGKIGDQTVSVYDTDADGLFRAGDDAIAAGVLDAKMSVFAPISANLATPGGVFQVSKLAEDGSEIEFSPLADKSRTLSVSFVGADLEARISMISVDAKCSFVASAAKDKAQTMVVLPGSYALQYGLVHSPELKRCVATVIPGKMQPATVDGKSPSSWAGRSRSTSPSRGR